MSQSEKERRALFDQEAVLYDEMRPGYPDALIADVISLSAIPPGGRILEIGSGTGKASLPFAGLGYSMLCSELGSHLAAVARQHLALYPKVAVWVGAFEDWEVEVSAFDLAMSATAFHWLDPAVALPKIARALRPDGALALFWYLHVEDEQSRDQFEALRDVYRREVPELASTGPQPRSHELVAKTVDTIDRTGLFGPVTVRSYEWDVSYDTAAYLRLLCTYADHIALHRDRRDGLLQALAAVIDARSGGRVRVPYVSTLYVARPAGAARK
jgi:SAM-dependent methyltransferase